MADWQKIYVIGQYTSSSVRTSLSVTLTDLTKNPMPSPVTFEINDNWVLERYDPEASTSQQPSTPLRILDVRLSGSHHFTKVVTPIARNCDCHPQYKNTQALEENHSDAIMCLVNRIAVEVEELATKHGLELDGKKIPVPPSKQ